MTTASVDVSVDDSRPKPPRRTGKRGGQFGNLNSLRHGLTCGSIPQGSTYISRSVHEFRRAVEDALIAAKGEVSLYDAALVQTAARHETHALLAARWLRREFESMSLDQRLMFSREVGRASSERDKCLKLLNLDRDARANIFDGLYQVREADVDNGPDDETDDKHADQDDDADAQDRDQGRTIEAAQADRSTGQPDADGPPADSQADRSNVLGTAGDTSNARDDAEPLDADPTEPDALALATALLDGVPQTLTEETR